MHLPNETLLQGGKYRIVRFLSSGGFGNTYEGVHIMMDTRVAIKEFFPKMFCNRDENTSHVTVATSGNHDLVDKLRKKFNEEAKAVFQMNHPNIVRVLDIFEENGTAYYVMEYIGGKSLNEITKERGALPEAEAVGYIRQVADALKYVHSLNRLHLDIKPGNIMVDKNGKAILIDFGASKYYDDESGENTSTLMGVNTKGYAPIEQSTQSFTSFSPATDIYALGATLYKLLTGIVPPDANLLLAEEETLQPLSSSISVPTRNAVMAAMQLRRKDRPQSIEEWMTMFSMHNSCQIKPVSTETEETIFDFQVSEQNRKDYKSEFYKTYSKELEREAENADAGAEYALACCYDEGLGIKVNIQLAIYWFEKAGNHGYIEAMVRLGFIYWGTAELYSKYANPNKCIFWYTKAAELGDEYACFELGRFYKEGRIIKKDIAKAKYWFDKVITQGGNYKNRAINELRELKNNKSPECTINKQFDGDSKGNFITRYLSKKWRTLTENVSSFFYLIIFGGSFGFFVLAGEVITLSCFVALLLTSGISFVLALIASWLLDEDSGFVQVSRIIYISFCILAFFLLGLCAYFHIDISARTSFLK